MASAGDSIELTTSRVPTRLLVVLTTVGLVLGALGWSYALFSGPRDEMRSDRQAVITRASDFTAAFVTYDMDKKAEYQARVKKLVTPKYYKEFTKVTDALFKALQDREMSSGNVNVLSIAVDSIDKDSAVAIAAVNSSVRVPGEKGAVLRRVRGKISLQKVDDRWLVSKFDTVPVAAASGGGVQGEEGAGQ